MLLSSQGQTHFGRPDRVLQLGSTEIPEDLFDAFLEELVRTLVRHDDGHLSIYRRRHRAAHSSSPSSTRTATSLQRALVQPL